MHNIKEIRNDIESFKNALDKRFLKIDLDKIDTTHLPELEQFMLHKIYSLNSNFKWSKNLRHFSRVWTWFTIKRFTASITIYS